LSSLGVVMDGGMEGWMIALIHRVEQVSSSSKQASRKVKS